MFFNPKFNPTISVLPGDSNPRALYREPAALDFKTGNPYLAHKKTTAMDGFMIRHNTPQAAQQLRIKGTVPSLTPRPDDAELAAQALLEKLLGNAQKAGDVKQADPARGTAEYFRRIAGRMKSAHAYEELQTRRFVAWAEGQLRRPGVAMEEIAAVENDLYQYQASAEREGGGLLRRWQHCLAECIVRQMPQTGEDSF
jgi:hypothetical protein